MKRILNVHFTCSCTIHLLIYKILHMTLSSSTGLLLVFLKITTFTKNIVCFHGSELCKSPRIIYMAKLLNLQRLCKCNIDECMGIQYMNIYSWRPFYPWFTTQSAEGQPPGVLLWNPLAAAVGAQWAGWPRQPTNDLLLLWTGSTFEHPSHGQLLWVQLMVKRCVSYQCSKV